MVARRIAARQGSLTGSEPADRSGAEIDYPSSDGEPMAESERQLIPMAGTFFILRDWYRDRPDVYIGCDLLIYYREGDNGVRVAPDVFAVFGATGNHPRDSWKLWEEGKAPDFVLEIASPSTWREDIDRKREIYLGLGVSEYLRFDPTGELFTPPLAWEELEDGAYRPRSLSTSPDGTLWGHSAVLGLDVCVRDDRTLQLYDPVSGQWFITPEEVVASGRVAAANLQSSEAARLAAEADRQAAEAARQIAESGRQAAEADRLVAETARQTAESARQTAEADRQVAEAARQAAEEENRQLREQLRRLQSGS